MKRYWIAVVGLLALTALAVGVAQQLRSGPGRMPMGEPVAQGVSETIMGTVSAAQLGTPASLTLTQADGTTVTITLDVWPAGLSLALGAPVTVTGVRTPTGFTPSTLTVDGVFYDLQGTIALGPGVATGGFGMTGGMMGPGMGLMGTDHMTAGTTSMPSMMQHMMGSAMGSAGLSSAVGHCPSTTTLTSAPTAGTANLTGTVDLTRTDAQGNVEVALTYLPEQGEGDLMFAVTLNTHSVNLDIYDLTQLAVLRDANGQEYVALAWESPEGGGHHRSGVLRFPGVTASGTQVAELPFFEVVIRSVADVPERIFRWETVSHRNERLGIDLHWTVDADSIYVGLVAPTTGWIGWGIKDPEAVEEQEGKAGADMVVAFVKDGQLSIIDAFQQVPAGPPLEDTTLGGTDDLIESAGSEEAGSTTLEFHRRLGATDQFDVSIPTLVEVFLAYGQTDDFAEYHQANRTEFDLNLATGEAEEEWPAVPHTLL